MEKKIRGRNAIDQAHSGITGQDEARLDATISSLYGVENEEAAEIHANYHLERIFTSLERRARENGMKGETLAERVQYMDLYGIARQVAQGKMAETAAVDFMFRSLATMESKSGDDRYVKFYG